MPTANRLKRKKRGSVHRYLVECDGKGYTITSQNDGSVVRLEFELENRTWNVVSNGESYKLMTFIDDAHVEMMTPSGEMRQVELSQQGVWAYQQMVNETLMANVK